MIFKTLFVFVCMCCVSVHLCEGGGDQRPEKGIGCLRAEVIGSCDLRQGAGI